MRQWKGIDEFLAVAEADSFSRAAERLGLAVSQVSKRVAELEARLGATLFDRSTRKLHLTSQGRLLYQAARKVVIEFQEIQDSIQRVNDNLTGHLRICAVGGSRPAFQMYLHSAFLDAYPGLTLEVIYSDTLPDMIAEDIDLALVVGDVDNAAPLVAYQLTWIDYALIASPSLMASHPVPLEPADLSGLPCILDGTNAWRLSNGETSILVDVVGRFASRNMPAAIDACLAGLGVYMAPVYNLDVLTQAGKVQRLLPDWHIRKSLHAVVRSADYLPLKIIVMMEYFIEAMAADKGEGRKLVQNLKKFSVAPVEIVQSMINGTQRVDKEWVTSHDSHDTAKRHNASKSQPASKSSKTKK